MARLGASWQRITHIVLTHLHTDHVGGLAPLLFALKNGLEGVRDAPLTLLGPPGLRHHLNALALAHGSYVLDPGFPLLAHELRPGESWRQPPDDFSIDTVAARHTENSLAIRLDTLDGSLGYTGDTGPDPGLGPFFRGCQLLLAECSHPDGQSMETHLTPCDLADLAVVSSPALLVPVHSYPSLDPDDLPGLLKKAGYEGEVLPGWDGLGLDLTDGVVTVLEPLTE